MTLKRGLHRSVISVLSKRSPVTASPPRIAVAASKSSLPSSVRTLTTTRAALQNAKQPDSPNLASSPPSPKATSTSTNSAHASTAGEDVVSRSRRSMLYVPGSSEKMIKKSQSSPADTIIFDLEDSVAAHKKGSARETVFLALEAAARPGPELAVRINPPSADRSLAEDDLDMVLPSHQLQAIVVPKVEHEDDIRLIIEKARALRPHTETALALVLSVESASSLLRMPRIIESIRESLGQDPFTGALLPSTKQPVAQIVALLFASEDYCASTGIVRTRARTSLLFPRAHMATIAKAYHLAAIDMVCIDYSDHAYLVDEASEAKQLGFDGKQAIHPVQVEAIQHTFNPTPEAVVRAARILFMYERASATEHRGAYGLREADGGMTMIDRPMLLQASAVVDKARRAGMRIPEASELEKEQD
ncbi:related to citrate lyase beta subunit [Sporisorium reilianum f. sp. reilianum]|uniref:Related to citrate lyase beta subunit n=1 Tax=Sporisorium reilianum f. sp. reilianum TaxID=72559 RepID=A0A2N8UJU5_9BASI|nr:related to citrate lyase beta subunit [Sporisorium reilianum f. sp. reilianum]